MSQTWGAWWGLDLVRTILGWIDWVFFEILGWVYEVFYAVANAELFTGETVYNFIARIQLILGIFMVFKLTIMILKSMVNPDYLNDKQAGTSQIITRIVTSLVMLSLVMPLNIQNPRNRYQVEVNNNGIMFGTLYSLQKRILENDVLGQLILGNDAPRRASDGSVVSSGLPGIKDKFISTIAKGFVQRNHKEQGSDDYMCPDNDYVKDNNYDNATVTDLFLDHLNDECGNKFLVFGTNYYAFAYVPIVGGIVAIIFTILFAVFSIDIAIRAIKLSVLRLIAPIPVISYMEPGQEKNGAFASWLKLLIATYLDLFIRLAMVYFALFLIDDIIKNGLIMNGSMGVSGITGVVAFIVICVGLLMFAKMAPKFIIDALGIKTHMSNIGLSGFLAGAAAIGQGGSWREVRDVVSDSARANIQAQNQGKAGMGIADSINYGRDEVAKIITGDSNMTGRKMTRGQRHLDALGINNKTVKQAKNDFGAASAQQSLAQDQYDRFVRGQMTEDEANGLAQNFGVALEKDESGNYTVDSRERMRQALYEDLQNKKLATQDASDKVEDYKGMQKKYGQARTFEAKYNANRTNRAALPSRQRFRDQSVVENGQEIKGTGSTTPNSSLDTPDFTPLGQTSSSNINNAGGGPGGPMPPGGPR